MGNKLPTLRDYANILVAQEAPSMGYDGEEPGGAGCIRAAVAGHVRIVARCASVGMAACVERVGNKLPTLRYWLTASGRECRFAFLKSGFRSTR